MFKNKWLLIGLILMTIFSSIGNSVTVIAETLDSSSLETSETLDEQELSSDIGVENENTTVESAVQEMVMGDSQVDKEMKSLDSIEIQGQTRDWSPSTSIQAEAVRNWVSQQLDSYFNLSNEKLGRNVGDKIVKTINFPDYMGIAAYKGEGNWNGQWHIQLGKTKLDSNGYFKFSNFSFTHSSDISVSLSGSDTDKTRTLTITRLKKSPDERYSIKANYYFESRGVMYNDYGIISGKYNTIYPSGDGKQIDMNLEAIPQLNVVWGNSIIFGTREMMDGDLKPFKTASTLTLNNSSGSLSIKSNIGNAADDSGSIPSGLIIDWGQSREALNASLYSMGSSNYLTNSNRYLVHSAKGTDSVSDTVNKFPSSQKVSQGDILRAYSNVSMNDRTSKPRIRHMENTDEFNDVKDGQNEVFYQITNNGYQVLHFNHLENDNTFEIFTSDTQESLNEKLKNKEFLTSGIYESVEVIKFSVYPNNSKSGNTTGSIQVREKLVNGNYVYYDYEVPFTVKDDVKISANPNKQKVNLGSDFSKVSPYNLVKDVKLGNQTLTKDEYTVAVQNTVTTDTVGDKTAKVLITYKKDTSKTLALDVPIKVLWGHTLGSNNVIYSGSTGFSLSLLTEESPNIVATLGNGKNSGNWINDYRNGTYITTSLYKDSQVLNSKNTNPYLTFDINGRDSAKNATDKWNNLSNRSEISYGDVLQYDVLTNWGDNKWVMRDETQIFESLGKQSIYYEITKEGYKTLHLNHLETKNITIPIYSTEEYLDEHINEYIDLKGYTNISVKEFSQYPNTKASGQQKGKIIVEETLTTGKKVQYEYEVTFIIGEGELTYSVPKTLTFKEFTKSKSEQTIQRMYSGDLGLKISDNRGQGKQGNWRLTAQVNQSEELSPYLIFRDGTSQDKYLNQGAVEIYFQAKQSNPAEPLNVEVSDQWLKDTGILLKVPSKNHLSSKQYTSTITWNLVEGP